MSTRQGQLTGKQKTHMCITTAGATRVIGAIAAAMIAANSSTPAAAADDLPGTTNSLAVVYASPSEASNILAILPANTELAVVCLAVPPFGAATDGSTQHAASEGPVPQAFWKMRDRDRTGYIGISHVTLTATHNDLVHGCDGDDLPEPT